LPANEFKTVEPATEKAWVPKVLRPKNSQFVATGGTLIYRIQKSLNSFKNYT